MKVIEFTVENAHGLHARPASSVVQICNQFDSQVTLTKDNVKGNGKSIIGIMKLAIAKGDTIRIEIDGPDEALAYEMLTRLVDTQFEE